MICRSKSIFDIILERLGRNIGFNEKEIGVCIDKIDIFRNTVNRKGLERFDLSFEEFNSFPVGSIVQVEDFDGDDVSTGILGWPIFSRILYFPFSAEKRGSAYRVSVGRP